MGLLNAAESTKAFKPLEIEALRELLDDLHAGHSSDHMAITYAYEGKPIGFAYYAPTAMTDRCWHLYWLFVSQEIRAKGIGSELLRHVEGDIARSGGRILLIETSGLPSYDLTRRFYLKHKYEQEATVRDFYADGDDQVVFRKRLMMP